MAAAETKLRRIRLLLLTGLLAFASPPVESAPISKQTFTYKRVGDLEIKLDVYRYDDKLARKVAVWIHGGALINGGRQGVSARVKRDMLNAGYVLVSLDYRLAPETKLPGIIEDLEDAFEWIRKHGAAKFDADVSRIAVVGGSAGGYLTLTSGFRIAPPPSVLVSFWGYGDLVGPWYSSPSPHPRHNRKKISRQEARRNASGPPIANASDRKGDGGAVYLHARQQGSWPTLVTGWDPHKEPEKFHPFMAVKNVSKSFPPTLMIHGKNDTDVPHEQSVMMATEFERHGVEHRLISVSGGEHGLAGASSKAVESAWASVLPFVQRHMDAESNGAR